jgi:hypothetical protein
MCSVSRALTGVATGGLSETVRSGIQIAKGDLTGGLMGAATFGLNQSPIGSALLPKQGVMPTMPLPNMTTTLPGVPPPPAATAGSTQVASPFSLSIRPRKSQTLRTDRSPVGQ